MKKIILFVAMLMISLSSFANHASELKSNLRALKNDIASYTGNNNDYLRIKSTPVKYDSELEMAEVTFECPGLWKGKTYYVAYNIDDVMCTYANVERVTDWRYDDEYVFCEYRCNIDDNNYYVVMMNYYRNTNTLVITMYDPVIGD